MIWAVIGFVVGVVIGVAFSACAIRKQDKEAVTDGVIVLDGKLYLLKEFDS